MLSCHEPMGQHLGSVEARGTQRTSPPSLPVVVARLLVPTRTGRPSQLPPPRQPNSAASASPFFFRGGRDIPPPIRRQRTEATGLAPPHHHLTLKFSGAQVAGAERQRTG